MGSPLLMTLAFGLLLGAIAAVLWSRGQQLRDESGLPAGDIIYTDSGAWIANDAPLFAPDLRLTGKPDYLIERPQGDIIPVEIKSSRAPAEPWEGHVFQLAAYCLLVEEHYGVRPPFGIIQYQDQAFEVDYTIELEEDLLDLLAEMREARFMGELDRDHNDWPRCQHCSMRSHCYQRLA